MLATIAKVGDLYLGSKGSLLSPYRQAPVALVVRLQP
jgi:hypothetical protein